MNTHEHNATITRLGARLAALGLAFITSACVAGEDEMADTDAGIDQAGEVDPDDLPPSIEPLVIAELELINGSLITFYEFEDGSVAARERGEPTTNAIGMLPELHGATPLEVYRAVAPDDAPAPEVLVRDHERARARRAADGEASPVPAGFRVQQVEGFFEPEQPRWFNVCTSNVAWMNHVGSSSIGSNCPGSSGKDWYACWTSFMLPHQDNCAGTNCTKYFTNGYQQVRASTCARPGSGYIRFAMGLKDDNSSNWSTWFDETLYTGYYYYYWYSSSTKKDFWHLLYRTGNKKANWSLWLD